MSIIKSAGALAAALVLSLVFTMLGVAAPAAAEDPAPGVATFEVGACGEVFRDLYPVTLNYTNTSGVEHSLLVEVSRRYTDESVAYGYKSVPDGGVIEDELFLNDWLFTGFPHGVIDVTLRAKDSPVGSSSDPDLPGFSVITRTFDLPKCGPDPMPGPKGGSSGNKGKPAAKLVKKHKAKHEVRLAVVRLSARQLKTPGVTTFKVRVRKLRSHGVARYRTVPVKVRNGRFRPVSFRHLKLRSKLVVRVDGKVIYRRVL